MLSPLSDAGDMAKGNGFCSNPLYKLFLNLNDRSLLRH